MTTAFIVSRITSGGIAIYCSPCSISTSDTVSLRLGMTSNKAVFRRFFLPPPFSRETIKEIALDLLARSAVWILSSQEINQLRYAESTTLR
jgi:hypothetical protein